MHAKVEKSVEKHGMPKKSHCGSQMHRKGTNSTPPPHLSTNSPSLSMPHQESHQPPSRLHKFTPTPIYDTLPIETLLHCLTFLPLSSLHHLSLTCQYFANIVRNERYMSRVLYESYFRGELQSQHDFSYRGDGSGPGSHSWLKEAKMMRSFHKWTVTHSFRSHFSDEVLFLRWNHRGDMLAVSGREGKCIFYQWMELKVRDLTRGAIEVLERQCELQERLEVEREEAASGEGEQHEGESHMEDEEEEELLVEDFHDLDQAAQDEEIETLAQVRDDVSEDAQYASITSECAVFPVRDGMTGEIISFYTLSPRFTLTNQSGCPLGGLRFSKSDRFAIVSEMISGGSNVFVVDVLRQTCVETFPFNVPYDCFGTFYEEDDKLYLLKAEGLFSTAIGYGSAFRIFDLSQYLTDPDATNVATRHSFFTLLYESPQDSDVIDFARMIQWTPKNSRMVFEISTIPCGQVDQIHFIDYKKLNLLDLHSENAVTFGVDTGPSVQLEGFISGIQLTDDEKTVYANVRPYRLKDNPQATFEYIQERQNTLTEGDLLVDENMVLHEIDMETLSIRQTFRGSRCTVTQLPGAVFTLYSDSSPDLVCSGGEDGYIHIWSRNHGQHVCAANKVHDNVVNKVEFNPKDQRIIASCSDDFSVKISMCTRWGLKEDVCEE